MVEYDEYGYKKEGEVVDGHNFRDFLAPSGDNAGFEFVAADEEAQEKAKEILDEMKFRGRKHIDKKVEKMTQDEKEVFAAVDGDEINDFMEPGHEIVGQIAEESDMKVPEKKMVYEEIEDDFISILNGGMPALELISEVDKKKFENEAINDNQDVIVVGEENDDEMEEDQDPNMISNYKERMKNVLELLEKQQDYKKEAALQGEK